MNIIWITKENPLHADRGDLLYSGGLVRALAAAGAQVTIVSYARQGRAHVAVDGIRSIDAPPLHNRLRARSLLSRLPSDSYRHRSLELKSLVMDELTRETVQGVVIDYYAMGWILDDLLTHPSFVEDRSRPILIYTAHHYEQTVRPFVARSFRGNPLLKVVLPFDASKAARLERRILASADLVTSITDEDRNSFLKDVPDTPILTLSPGYSGPLRAHQKIGVERPRRVLLVGAFDWIAKRQNLREFVTACCEPFASAKIELLIVGRADTAFIAEIKGIYPACEFVGPVPDVYPYIGNARIGLMPDIIGGGFKLKYLDYIFGGLPVATIRSQALGLPLDIDNDMIAAENHFDLVKCIVANIDNHERLDGMRQRAFAACKDAFNWSDRGRQFYDAISRIKKKAADADAVRGT